MKSTLVPWGTVDPLVIGEPSLVIHAQLEDVRVCQCCRVTGDITGTRIVFSECRLPTACCQHGCKCSHGETPKVFCYLPFHGFSP
jgi:hypothetical protein